MKSCWVLAAVSLLAVQTLSASVHGEEKLRYLELETKMNRKLTDDLGSGAAGNSLSALPTGEQTLADVKFKVGPGLLQLGSKFLESWPNKIEGIAVDGKFDKLHILHGTCFGRGKAGNTWFVEDGALVGQLTVQYEDGSSEGVPIVYGQDVRDWWLGANDKQELGRARVAWTGDNAVATEYGCRLRLYVTTWNNPKPDKKVTGIDYRSNSSETVAAPFCLAISVEQK